MRVIWSKRALKRVEQIALYIAEDSPQAAIRWVDDIFAALERLVDFPAMGKPGRDILTPGVREFVFGEFGSSTRSARTSRS